MNLNESKLWKEIHQQDECVRECLKYNLPILKEIAFNIKQRNIKILFSQLEAVVNMLHKSQNMFLKFILICLLI